MPQFEFGEILIADPSDGLLGVVRIEMNISYPVDDESGAETLKAYVAVPYDLNASIADIRHSARVRMKSLLESAIVDLG